MLFYTAKWYKKSLDFRERRAACVEFSAPLRNRSTKLERKSRGRKDGFSQARAESGQDFGQDLRQILGRYGAVLK